MSVSLYGRPPCRLSWLIWQQLELARDSISMKAETETLGGQYLPEITWPVGGRADVKLQHSDCWFRRLSFIVYACLWVQIMPPGVFPK